MTRSSNRKINTAPYIPIATTQKAKATTQKAKATKAKAKMVLNSKPFKFIPDTLYTYDKNMTREEHAFNITQMIKNIFETKKPFSM